MHLWCLYLCHWHNLPNNATRATVSDCFASTGWWRWLHLPRSSRSELQNFAVLKRILKSCLKQLWVVQKNIAILSHKKRRRNICNFVQNIAYWPIILNSPQPQQPETAHFATLTEGYSSVQFQLLFSSVPTFVEVGRAQKWSSSKQNHPRIVSDNSETS